MSDLDLDANQAEVKRILTALSLEVPGEVMADVTSRIERRRKELVAEVEALRERVATLENERDAWLLDRDYAGVCEERDAALGRVATLEGERDEKAAEVERLTASYGWLDQRFPEVKAERDALRGRYGELERDVRGALYRGMLHINGSVTIHRDDEQALRALLDASHDQERAR